MIHDRIERLLNRIVRLTALLVLTTGPASQASSDRLHVFISDLHVGVGYENSESRKWHRMEDFRWESEFAHFLDEIRKLGAGKTTLVFLGDAFELWQSPDISCAYTDADWSCTKEKATERLKRIITSTARSSTV